MEELVYELLTSQGCGVPGLPPLYGIRLTQPATGRQFEIADLSADMQKMEWFLALVRRNRVTLDEIAYVVDNAFWHRDCL